MKTLAEIMTERDSKSGCSEYAVGIYHDNFKDAEKIVRGQLEKAPEAVKAKVLEAFGAACVVVYNPNKSVQPIDSIAAELRENTMRIGQNMGIK